MTDESKPSRFRNLPRHLRTILLAVLLALTIRTGIAQAYVVEGPSMMPTLIDGDRVLVVKYAYGLTLPFADAALLSWSDPDPGDVVILTSPLDGTELVKRVVGLPGDTIQVSDDLVYRNGMALSTGVTGPCPQTETGEECQWYEEGVGEHTWRAQRSPTSASYSEPVVIVPEGQVFVLGDHRDRSNDSRFFGPVPVARLRGRVVGVD